jgi:hypothetical protein
MLTYETQNVVTKTKCLNHATGATTRMVAVIAKTFSAVFAIVRALVAGLDTAGEVGATTRNTMPRKTRFEEGIQGTVTSSSVFAANDATVARSVVYARRTRPFLKLELPNRNIDCLNLATARLLVATFQPRLAAFRLPTRLTTAL